MYRVLSRKVQRFLARGEFAATVFVASTVTNVAAAQDHPPLACPPILDPSSGCSPTLELVSVSSTGCQGGGRAPSMSGDGRFVAFGSWSWELVPGDNNTASDIFVHDRLLRTTEVVSISSSGQWGNAGSHDGVLSADGRLVLFWSRASNLVPDDSNDLIDLFIHDRQTRRTSRVNVNSLGEQSVGGHGNTAAMTPDGRFVAFDSNATNLVPDDTNAERDVFVHDRVTGMTERVSVDWRGEQANNTSVYASISADGRYVVFAGDDEMVPEDVWVDRDVYLHDRLTGQTTLVSYTWSGGEVWCDSHNPVISPNGRYVAFESCGLEIVQGDTNERPDLFVRDLETGIAKRVNVSSEGEEAEYVGRHYDGYADFSFSFDGRFVAFLSSAVNLVPGDTNNEPDIFVHDQQTGQTIRVNVGTGGRQADDESYHPSITANGQIVAFFSFANNLVIPDISPQDVFVYDLCPFSLNPPGSGVAPISIRRP